MLRVLAFALALAIPAQGLAAFTGGLCMAMGHHQDAGQDAHAHPQDAEAGHDHAGLDGADHAKHDGESKSSHCGPCAGCCASATIAGPAPLALPSTPTDTQYSFSQLTPPGIQPDGLDRPPLAL